ncbi:hypothetical protein PIROE2DRAFT_2824 [Piromyces sp. E2]|nr:hypothetical protein PIROE2DRAFT_2824 [Piromyces sp. E2]|eukprot:OUM69320.1 hypothetical protein PIROE2DRAFT_2824 [Piromyces sp. E2]
MSILIDKCNIDSTIETEKELGKDSSNEINDKIFDINNVSASEMISSELDSDSSTGPLTRSKRRKIESLSGSKYSHSLRSSKNNLGGSSSTEHYTRSKRRKVEPSSMNKSSNSSRFSEDIIIPEIVYTYNSITSNMPKEIKSLKKNFNEINGIFKIKLFKNNSFINLDYQYNNDETVQQKLDSTLPKKKNDINFKSKNIYEMLENCIGSTIDKIDLEIPTAEVENYIDKFTNPYSKNNITLYKKSSIINNNRIKKENFESSEKDWESSRYPLNYICYNSLTGSTYCPVNFNYKDIKQL